jgi:hypothetical protein
MRNGWFIAAVLLVMASCGSGKKLPAVPPQPENIGAITIPLPQKNNCIDSSKINPQAMCTRIYLPVCGCDSVTYGNACEAEASGVRWWRGGECSVVKK